MTISACGGSACIAGVSRDCGHGIFQLEGGATRTQIKRDTSFATPGYLVLWGGEPLYGAVCGRCRLQGKGMER